MHFNAVFIATALLASAAPALSATITAFAGAGCTGAITSVDSNAAAGQCVFFTNGGSAKSFGYSGVPNSISFFKSGGPNDRCTNGAFLTLGGGSGCGTAPAGFNVESVSLS
ncbi:hypothetical protein FB451DRAFT_1556318 [Mycena latifolia]|nr:hypothetical protein FB451DRAFT_1274544 [Mycena latifolia]KAJ7480802.1 hypothetical protein FB451DRAFT_1365192 [Mycena latifolia]KAJ7480803.1 hypothetical protein FB451DRAFT_1556318 [Mycena latifolia]